MFLLAAWLLQPQKPPTDAERLAALQLSAACREAGDKLWQHGGYANQPGFMGDYLTHYNRQESKCLIRIVRMTDEPTNKTMFMMVFDAIESSLLASQLAKFDGKEYVITYLDSYDGLHKHDRRPPTTKHGSKTCWRAEPSDTDLTTHPCENRKSMPPPGADACLTPPAAG